MKHLILKYIETIDDKIWFRIHDQSHVYYEFGDNHSHTFLAQNGFRISSIGYPQMNTRSNEILVRGDCEGGNEKKLSATIDDWNKIKEAVQEYNTYFGFIGECIIGETLYPILPEEMFTL